MTAKTRPRPWHQVVSLKDELRSGALSLAEFAADLHEVTLGEGRRTVYEDPKSFFALTYPTHPLRELVKDVAGRLRGRSDKAVRQLELTYGGGKTHTLITLYHLFRDPQALPDVPAVREFRSHVGADLPRAFTVALCFDKIDAERGIEDVRAPDGETRTLRHPWSVLAFQLAGAEGLRMVHAEGRDEERETPPAEPLLRKLIEKPLENGLATLILVDEVLMYAREKAGINLVWRSRIEDFFQYLTQAVTKVDRAAIVASLLATDPGKQRGKLGSALVSGLFDVFRRQREEGVQPVRKEDVAEVLRRRFFAPEDIRTFRPHAISVVQGLARLDEATAKDKPSQEARFLESFPFHPDLTDVFYSRWTQLEGFQRTRGILRILATALREAEAWDNSPVIGPSVLLAAPGVQGVSEAMRELAGVATAESSEGRRTEWVPLLEAELVKARQIQDELPALANGREAEQAVATVFLHSQPIGHKVNTPDLFRMAGSSAPDAIELEKGLRRWREISWFLDDEDLGVDEPTAALGLPKSWRLGHRPNLRQMHDEACRQRVGADAVEARLEDAIRATKALTDGARAAGAVPHLLPPSPRDVGDDGSFRYVVLGAAAASDSGRPGALAKRFLDEAGGPERPRVHRNAVVVAAPSRDGLEAARVSVRTLLGWEDVAEQLQGHKVDPMQEERLRRRLQEGRVRLPDVIRQAWSAVVTVDEGNAVHAFKLAAGAGPLFAEIKNDPRARIKETAVDAAALLPDGPYDLWREGEEARFVKDLAGAFARHPRLPKVLNPKVLLDTVLQGVERGLLVARLARPDGSARSWWREAVDPEARNDPQLEAVLPEKAALSRLPENLLALDVLPQLWEPAGQAYSLPGQGGTETELTLRAIKDYFSGGKQVSVASGAGYDESLAVPHCPEEEILDAARRGVEQGTVWLTNGPTSLWKEHVPVGALDGEDVAFRPPPAPIPPQELLEEALPGAWKDGKANGAALVRAASQVRGAVLPWGIVRDSIRDAVESRWLQLAEGSGPVDYGYDEAGNLRLERPETPQPSPVAPAVGDIALEGWQIQGLSEIVSDMMKAAAGSDLRFHVRVTVAGDASDETRAALDKLLATVSEDLKATR